MNLTQSFENAFSRKRKRNWDHIYVFVDIHDTIFASDYGAGKNFNFYKDCKQTLQLLSKRSDIVLGLLTASYEKDIEEYQSVFKENDINFQLVNENPMEQNTKLACFDKKPYFNVLIDDKAGFIATKDWTPILQYVELLNKADILTAKLTYLLSADIVFSGLSESPGWVDEYKQRDADEYFQVLHYHPVENNAQLKQKLDLIQRQGWPISIGDAKINGDWLPGITIFADSIDNVTEMCSYDQFNDL